MDEKYKLDIQDYLTNLKGNYDAAHFPNQNHWYENDAKTKEDDLKSFADYIQRNPNDIIDTNEEPDESYNYLSDAQRTILEKYRDTIVIDFDNVKKYLITPIIERILNDSEYSDDDKELLNEIRVEYIEFNKKDDDSNTITIDLESLPSKGSTYGSGDAITAIQMMMMDMKNNEK